MNVPPLVRLADVPRMTVDPLSHEGALVICRKIEEVWAAAGHPQIRAEPSQVENESGNKMQLWGVRIHGLLNGLPSP